ncbi:MAG: hypothetical protein D6802_09535, partial [Ardenticatenia bacterium]
MKAGVQNGSIVPVLFGASVEALGVERLMEAIVNLLPSPVEAPPEKAINKETGEE